MRMSEWYEVLLESVSIWQLAWNCHSSIGLRKSCVDGPEGGRQMQEFVSGEHAALSCESFWA